MAIHINGHFMTLTVDNHVVATARFSQHAAADGNGAWIVSTLPARLFGRNQAITAMALAEVCPAAARGGNWERMRPHIQGWAAELGMTAEQAATRIIAPPDWAAAAETDPARPDPEAGA